MPNHLILHAFFYKIEYLNIRWSPCFKQCEKDLDNTDNCRLILLLVKNIRKQLLHRFLPKEHRHVGEEVFVLI